MKKLGKWLLGTRKKQQHIPVVISSEIKIIQMKNLTDKEIEDLFDDGYKDTMFDDESDYCVTSNAYKKGFKKAIEMMIENS